MKEQGRPTLTLRRKTESEGQRAVNNSSEPDGAGPGRVTRKKTVVVNATPAWKVRKQAVDESAKKAQADEKAARDENHPVPESVTRRLADAAKVRALLKK
ncbi:DUF1380 domain-containing protein [Salmonella enterica]|nr:DUF1380 domain-containing protein [Salmonella enterica]EBQ0860423.1 DUF1380 domain-containing protein [Salmonella enterica]